MSGPVEFLDLDDVIELASKLLGDPPAIRDIGLLGSAVARPRTSAFGEDAYSDLWTKAAALKRPGLSPGPFATGVLARPPAMRPPF